MSDPKETSAPDYKATAEKLLSAANDGAKSLKALFFWYVGAITYAVISVAGVTYEQLLKEAPLKLPILTVDIPLVEYFAVLPLVVVLVHLELLVQFALLSNKVNEFERSLRHLDPDEASKFRLRIENFMLSHLLAGNHNAILHTLLFLLIQGALVALPLFALLTIQAQFLAYHSEPVMWWHRVLLLIDTCALLYFWPNLFHREDIKAGAWIKLMAFRVLPRAVAFLILLAAIYAALAWCLWSLTDIAMALGLVVVVAIVASLRISRWRRGQRIVHAGGRLLARRVLIPLYLIAALAVAYWIDVACIDSRVPVITLSLVAAIIGALFVARRWDGTKISSMTWARAERWVDQCHRQGFRHDAPGIAVFAAQCALAIVTAIWLLSIPTKAESTLQLAGLCFDGPPSEDGKDPLEIPAWRWLIMPAAPMSQGPFCEWVWTRYLAGDVVDGRASIPAILLRGMGMRRVLILDEKVLANQDLSPTQREKLRAGDADARNDIEPIDLRGRDLTGTQLNKAVLPRVRFSTETRLRNASLKGAQLQGAILPGETLHLEQLEGAYLQGATFEQSRIFEHALLSAMDLRDTSFLAGSLSGALLDKVVLNNVRIVDTDLYYTILIDPIGIAASQDKPTGSLAQVNQCLLFVSEGALPDPSVLSCAFVMHEGTLLGTPPTRDFWDAFWLGQMRSSCGVTLRPNSDPLDIAGYIFEPRKSVFSHLTNIYERLADATFGEPGIQADMAQSAIAMATSNLCRSHYSKDEVAKAHQRLADEIAGEAESGVVPTTIRQSEVFYADWLAELDRIEKAAGQPTVP